MEPVTQERFQQIYTRNLEKQKQDWIYHSGELKRLIAAQLTWTPLSPLTILPQIEANRSAQFSVPIAPTSQGIDLECVNTVGFNYPHLHTEAIEKACLEVVEQTYGEWRRTYFPAAKFALGINPYFGLNNQKRAIYLTFDATTGIDLLTAPVTNPFDTF